MIINKLLFVLKKTIYAAFLIYGYNILAINFNLVLPINIISLSFVSFFGSAGLFALIIFKYLIL